MKRNGHLTFQYVIDCWGMRSDAGMPSPILPYNAVAKRTIFMVQKINIEIHKNFKLD